MNLLNIVLGVCGGIAAYKACDTVSSLKKRGFDVHVIMTRSAQEFVKPLTFQSLSQNKVIVDMFERPDFWEIEHISLAKKADLFLVVPATANIIGKVANGIADDMLSTTIMASKAPVLFAPAMNTNMFLNSIVQSNIKNLEEKGYHFVQPASGRLACGDEGVGKLQDVEIILRQVASLLKQNQDYAKEKILITAGPTREALDPVRYIGNRSSGKMGYALVQAALERGAEVILISGPTNLSIQHPKCTLIPVESAQEMYDAVMNYYEAVSLVIKTAAVSDYRPEETQKEKIKKDENSFTVKLVKNPDILYELGQRKKHQFLVGFAAESTNIMEYGRDKLLRKNLDMICINDISEKNIGFDSDYNHIYIMKKDEQVIELQPDQKTVLAHRILDQVKK